MLSSLVGWAIRGHGSICVGEKNIYNSQIEEFRSDWVGLEIGSINGPIVFELEY